MRKIVIAATLFGLVSLQMSLIACADDSVGPARTAKKFAAADLEVSRNEWPTGNHAPMSLMGCIATVCIALRNSSEEQIRSMCATWKNPEMQRGIYRLMGRPEAQGPAEWFGAYVVATGLMNEPVKAKEVLEVCIGAMQRFVN